MGTKQNHKYSNYLIISTMGQFWIFQKLTIEKWKHKTIYVNGHHH